VVRAAPACVGGVCKCFDVHSIFLSIESKMHIKATCFDMHSRFFAMTFIIKLTDILLGTCTARVRVRRVVPCIPLDSPGNADAPNFAAGC
jgi:hypothetical protein